MGKRYNELKKKLKIVNDAINYPNGKSPLYDKQCDDTFFKYADYVINFMWIIFIAVSTINVFYFIRHHAF